MKNLYLINDALVSSAINDGEAQLTIEKNEHAYYSTELFKNDKEDFMLHLEDGSELAFPKDSLLLRKYVNGYHYLVVSEDTPFISIVNWIDGLIEESRNNQCNENRSTPNDICCEPAH